MNDVQPAHPVSYVLSIWSERQPDLAPVWHGMLQLAGGQRWHFATLAELERLLCEVGGWMDPPENWINERNSQ